MNFWKSFGRTYKETTIELSGVICGDSVEKLLIKFQMESLMKMLEKFVEESLYPFF